MSKSLSFCPGPFVHGSPFVQAFTGHQLQPFSEKRKSGLCVHAHAYKLL